MDKEYELDLKVAETALDWGIELAFDHHETVFEELLGKLEGDEYWLALERAKDTIEEIWEAGKEYLEMQKEALEIIRAYEIDIDKYEGAEKVYLSEEMWKGFTDVISKETNQPIARIYCGDTVKSHNPTPAQHILMDAFKLHREVKKLREVVKKWSI